MSLLETRHTAQNHLVHFGRKYRRKVQSIDSTPHPREEEPPQHCRALGYRCDKSDMSHTNGRPMPVATEEHRQYISELNDEARTRKANIAKLRARIATGARQDLKSVSIEPSHTTENATGAEQMRREIAQLKAQLKDAAAQLKAKDEQQASEELDSAPPEDLQWNPWDPEPPLPPVSPAGDCTALSLASYPG